MASIPPELVAASLVAVRLWAVLRAQVLWRTAVGWVWPLVALGLALSLAPMVVTLPVQPPVSSLLGWAALAGWELVVGTLLGALVSLPGYAVLGAGSTVALVTRSGAAPVTGLAVAVTTMAALALALHRPLLLGLVGSFEALPLGEPMTILGTGANALQSLGRALQVVTVLALALATPVLLTAMVVDVGLALLGRGPEAIVPATEAMRAWARSALALIALGASWAAYAEAWSRAAMPPQ